MSSKVNLLICLCILHLWVGTSVTGQKIGIYEIKKGDFSVKITNYGARIISVFLPDKLGKIGDIVLGYDTIEEYKNDTNYFGAVLGRVANRIAGAQFTLNGTLYKLEPNEGTNMLHGGPKGFSLVVWKVSKYVPDGPRPQLTLTYHSPDGENGQKIGIYEIKKGDFSVKITNYGARIISVFVPDKHGKIGDVVLGYDTIQEYKNDTSYFGALLGRVANRIGGAQYTLNGTLYKLVPNEGRNMIHGGPKGFSLVVWKVKKYVPDGPCPQLTLTYHSPDGDNGFPGDVVVSLTYALKDPYKFSMKMEAKALNKVTPINLSHHPYWNIGGHDSGNVLSHVLQIFASHITPADKESIPTGEISPVKNTPYDFLKPHTVGSRINQLENGYDMNYALDSKEKMKRVATVYDKKSGRVMHVQATAPGVILYTSDWVIDIKGKGGFVYQPHSALSLETQGFPDAVNHPNFPSPFVNPGKTYVHNVLYTFSTKK